MKDNSLKNVIENLEDLFQVLNSKYFESELAKPVITVSPNTMKVNTAGWCTYRAMERITKLESTFALDEVLQLALIKGLGKDDLNVIIKGFVDAGIKNKYVEAMKKIV